MHCSVIPFVSIPAHFGGKHVRQRSHLFEPTCNTFRTFQRHKTRLALPTTFVVIIFPRFVIVFQFLLHIFKVSIKCLHVFGWRIHTGLCDKLHVADVPIIGCRCLYLCFELLGRYMMEAHAVHEDGFADVDFYDICWKFMLLMKMLLSML